MAIRGAQVALVAWRVASFSCTVLGLQLAPEASVDMPCVESCRTSGIGCRGTFKIRGGDPIAGFGALFFGYTIQQLRFAEMHCLSPCIDFEQPLAAEYYVEGAGNPWEFYFEGVCPSFGVDVGKLQCGLNDTEIYRMNKDAVKIKYQRHAGEMGSVISRWYRLRPELRQELWDEWVHMTGSDAMPGQRKTPILGVHLRGSDRDNGMNWRGGIARNDSGPTLFLPEVQKFLDEFELGIVYIATDDTEFAESVKTWPSAVARAVRMREIKRADPGKHIFGLKNKTDEGKNALADLLFLSWCDRLLSSTSEISWAAQWWAAETSDHAHSYCPENPNITWNFSTPAVREVVATGDCPRYDRDIVWEGLGN